MLQWGHERGRQTGAENREETRGRREARERAGRDVASLTAEGHLETGDDVTALVAEAGCCRGGN